MMERGVPGPGEWGKLLLPCRICATGRYQERTPPDHVLRQVLSNEQGINAYEVKLRVLACNVCTHTIYFAPGFPEEAANKGWKVI
jgi:hypothetical protein